MMTKLSDIFIYLNKQEALCDARDAEPNNAAGGTGRQGEATCS